MANLTGTYNLDTAHSTIGFTVRLAMVTKVRGEFTDFDATLTIAENPAESTAPQIIIFDVVGFKSSSVNKGAYCLFYLLNQTVQPGLKVFL